MDSGRPTRGGAGPSLSSSGLFYHAGAGAAPSLSGAAASSLLTDANSPHLQRSASVNNDSVSRMIPTSPLSFSSNNEYTQKRGAAGASSATSEVTEQDTRFAKRLRSDNNRQEEIMQQQLMQLMQSPSCHQTPQMQAMLQQRRMAQQQQYSMMRAQMMQQQQVRSQMERHYAHPEAAGVVPIKGGVCARMLMKYFYHQRHGRTEENTIAYWRKFVGQYFAPHAKKKWCLSKYDNVGNHAFGVFPHTSVAAWQCDICGSKSGKGFEAASEVLPRLFQFKYDCGVPPQKNDGGVIDEILFLDMPHESRLPNGVMVLEYARAVQKYTYEQGHVIREGQLRIIFTPGLKIRSWEFCVRSHEEFLSRRLVAPQVSQLLQVAQKYQTLVTDGGSAGVSPQELQTMCNMFVSAGNQIVKNLDLQSLNDLGFAKRYVRGLQEAELVTSMKDLMDFEQEQKLGPIASMNSYARECASKLQNRRTMEEQPTANNLQTSDTMLNKIMADHMGMNNIHTGMPVHNCAGARSNYHNMQKNSMNPFQSALNQPGSMQFNRSSSVPTNLSVHGSPFINQQQLQSNGSMPQQVNAQPSLANKQHMDSTNAIDQILQEVLSNSEGASQSLTMPNMNSSMTTGDAIGVASNIGGMVGRMNASAAHSAPGRTDILNNNTMSRTNSQKSISNSTSVDGNSIDPKPDLPQISHTPEVEDDFTLAESGLLDAEFGDFDFGVE